MAEKHVVICDQCGKEEPLRRSDPDDLGVRSVPEGWHIVAEPLGEFLRTIDLAHLCSWACVARYATEQDVDA